MGKRALVCGISGQDGTYLAQLLLKRGYEVWGSSRDAEMSSFQNLRRLGLLESVRTVSLNSADVGGILSLFRRIRPDYVFSLAGQSSVGLSFEQPVETVHSIALGTMNLLEAIRLSDTGIRFYNAGSTECFGDTGNTVANELTQFHPRSPYAVAKASAYWMVANYRESYDMFTCTGILSNHDSPLRPRRFVTRKIIHAVASLMLGRIDAKISLGNLKIERDWGWAPEYVEAILLMLEQPQAADYVIGTGKSYTLTQFVETAFSLAGKDWRNYVSIDEHLMRPTDISFNKVDPSRVAADLGWKARFDMRDVVRMMLEAELEELSADRST